MNSTFSLRRRPQSAVGPFASRCSALGRAGLSLQIGTGIVNMIGRDFSPNQEDRQALIAVDAKVELATASNAAVARAIVVVEELVGLFEPAIPVMGRRYVGPGAGLMVCSHTCRARRQLCEHVVVGIWNNPTERNYIRQSRLSTSIGLSHLEIIEAKSPSQRKTP